MKQQFWKRLSTVLIVVLVVGLLPLFSQPQDTQAQSDDTALARVDDALNHLSGYLGTTVTRESSLWSWSEQVYNNNAMACGVPGVSYTPESTRGYQVQITIGPDVYDYRVKSDGSIIILCIEGQPHPTSVGIDVPTTSAPPPSSGQFQQLPAGTAWAWFFDSQTDILRLFNENGLVVELPRPVMDNEMDSATVRILVNQNGTRMVIISARNDQRYNFGVYDVATGSFIQTYVTEVGEQIYTSADNSAQLSSEDSQHIAIAAVNPQFETQNFTWRLMVINTQTGNIDFTLRSTDPAVVNAFSFAFGNEDVSFYLPVVRFFAANQIVFQLQPFGTEGSLTPPGFTWNFTSGEVGPWNVERSFVDLSFNSFSIVYPFLDENLPVPEPRGPMPTYNSIGASPLVGGQRAVLWQDETKLFTNAIYGSVDTQIIVNTSFSEWSVLDTNNNVLVDLPLGIRRVITSQNGFFSLSDQGVGFHATNDPINRNILLSGDVTSWQSIWALPPDGTQLGLSQIAVIDGANTSGASICPDAPVSRVTIGMRAQVSISDDGNPLPLRVRDNPGGEFITNIDEGVQFNIIGGPQCADGFTWWQVQLDDGVIGWSAEGSDDGYFMESATP